MQKRAGCSVTKTKYPAAIIFLSMHCLSFAHLVPVIFILSKSHIECHHQREAYRKHDNA